MNKLTLYLTDFRTLVRKGFFSDETNKHPVFYYERDDFIYFYKPVEHIVYYTALDKLNLPDNISVEILKQEFQAWELESRPDVPRQIIGTIS